MKNDTKNGKLGGIFYLICVLMLLAILTTAIMSAINNSRTVSPSAGRSTETAEKAETAETTGKPSKTVPSVKTVPNGASAETDNKETEAESDADSAANALPTEFTLPISGMVTKKFYGDVPVFSLTMNDYRTHLGLDLQGNPGTQVKAFADGVIDAIYTDEFMGNVMVVNHGGGLKSYYMNIGSEYPQGIEQGAEVTCGQTIAGVGQGCKVEALDGSHLHFEVALNGVRVDPLQYIDHATLADYEYEGNEE